MSATLLNCETVAAIREMLLLDMPRMRLRTLYVFSQTCKYYPTRRTLRLSGIGRVRERIGTLARHLQDYQPGLTLVEPDPTLVESGRAGVRLTPCGRAVVDLVRREFDGGSAPTP